MMEMGHCIEDIVDLGWDESRSNTVGKKTESDLPRAVDHNRRNSLAERHQPLVSAISGNDVKPYVFHTSYTPKFLFRFLGIAYERFPVIIHCGQSRSYDIRGLIVVSLDQRQSPTLSPSRQPVVTFRHVCKEYVRGRSRIVALQDICIEVPQGEFCALMGPSGSGKSTLLNLAAGLDSPTSGEILLEGTSTERFGDREWTMMRRDKLGIVFQAFHLVPSLTAAENVALPLRLGGASSSGSFRAQIHRMLELVGLQDRANHRPHELSGGEQQRVAIARAFVHQPRLILADEPTGNLDSRNGEEVVTLLRRCSQEFGQTVVLATHSSEAAGAADRRLSLRDGQLM